MTPSREVVRLELTQEQGQAVDQHAGGPLEVIDPRTGRVFLLIAAEPSVRGAEPQHGLDDPSDDIPPMIARAKAAFQRDFPMLLHKQELRGNYIAYAGEERIGVTPDYDALIRECVRRNIPDDHLYIGVIKPAQPPEVEEVEVGLLEFDDDESDASPDAFPT